MPKPAKSTTKTKSRPFLKWAGGKYRLTDEINRLLPKRKHCLVEPFVGAGAVFLLFNIVKQDVEGYIQACKPVFFHPDANTESYYYSKRKAFNQSTDAFQRAVLFLYLNRFGFNGLCRYNAKNEFNVPFGAYKTHYFPEEELRFFSAKAQSAVFICADFQQTFQMANEGCVIYCDPPYAPISQDSNFTNYSGNEFSIAHQRDLANLAKDTVKQRNIQVVISNHDTPFTREIYQGAKIRRLKVQRSISQAPHKRVKVRELIAVFNA